MITSAAVPGCLAPFRPDPKKDFIFNNGWYPLPKTLSGIAIPSLDEMINLLKGKDLGYGGEKFVDGFVIKESILQGIFVVGYNPVFARLQYNGMQHRDFKVGYQCGKCHEIRTGHPKIEIAKGNTRLTLRCGNEVCNSRLYEKELDYMYYNRNPADSDD
jgi:hypothetical protein